MQDTEAGKLKTKVHFDIKAEILPKSKVPVINTEVTKAWKQ